MSFIKHLLNPYLRITEKRHIARATPAKLRSVLEWNARVFFRGPRGAAYQDTVLSHRGQSVAAIQIDAGATGPLLLYFHGGGYVFGSPRTHRKMLAWISWLADAPVVLPWYRLAPEHPFPAATEDAMTAYMAVMDHPGGVILGGDSAGGGLALSLLGEITRLGLKQPLGSFAFSPVTDLSFSGESVSTNARADVVLPADRASEIAQLYLSGTPADDPRTSPLFAEFTGAGPVWLTVGDTEVLLDDTRRMATRLDQQGVAVTCLIERDLPHVWPLFKGVLPEAGQTLRHLAKWIKALSLRSSGS